MVSSKWVLVCAIAFAVACASGTKAGTSDASGSVCGDGVCDPSEITSCPKDCGSGSGSCGDGVCESNESPATCPEDCHVAADAGMVTIDAGSGALDCNSDEVAAECVLCLLDDVCEGDITVAACEVCAGI